MTGSDWPSDVEPQYQLPRWARWALWLLMHNGDRRAAASELSELYEHRLELGGKRAARRWLRNQVLAHLLREPAYRLQRANRRRNQARKHATTSKTSASALGSFTRDLRYSIRALVKVPVLTLTIILTVGLGIGATTAIFSVVNSVLLRGLPYTNAHQLYRIYTDSPPNRWALSVVDYLAIEEQETQLAALAGYFNVARTYTDGDVAERLLGKFVTRNYFPLLGVLPARGRLFDESDAADEDVGRVVISHSFWQRRLNGDDGALGRTIQLDGRGYEVIGVLPKTVGPLERGRDFFAVTRFNQPTRKGPFFVTTLARLEEGADVEAASQELKTICRRIFPIWEASWQQENVLWGMMGLKEFVVGDVGLTLILVLGAVGLVLLIASSNAANLLLARANQRRAELAVRSALGASRYRLLGHVLSESAVLALCGGLMGVAVAVTGTELLTTLGAAYIPRTQEVQLDARVVLFLAALTTLSGLLFGLIPSISSAASRMENALHTEGRGTTGSTSSRRLQRGFVVAQFAVAAPLLVGAGLLLGSLARMQRVDPGIDTTNTLSFSMSLPAGDYPDSSAAHTFWNEALARVKSLPGVEAATLGTARPPRSLPGTNNFDLEDKPTPPEQSQPSEPWISVMPDYFEALGIPLLEGRVFDQQDASQTQLEVVVDQAWARRFFPGESAVGRRFKSGGCSTCPWQTVVGVVGDVKYRGLDAPAEGVVYQSLFVGTFRFRYVLIHTAGEPTAVLPSVRNVLREMDPTLPLLGVATLDDLMRISLDEPRYLAMLVAAFAVVSLVLSVVGIYGVMSHFVQRHRKDIGIRIALGGGPATVLRSIVGQGMRLVAIGLVMGVIAAYFITRTMSGLLFEVEAADPVTYMSVAAAMLGVAFVACFIPARRAAEVDPARTLRVE